jgi:hypothetical protein
MANRLIFLVIGLSMAHAGLARAQSKEDLLGGTPVDQSAVIAVIQQPAVANSLAGCGAGKLSAGSVTMTLSVTSEGKGTLTAIDPALPPDISGCLGGVIGSLAFPTSGSGGQVAFVFTFPASPPPGSQVPVKTFDPRFTPEYQAARRMKKSGVGLLIPGCILGGLGALTLGVSFADSSSSAKDNGIKAGAVLMAIGFAMIIPGAILTARGNKGQRDALIKYNSAMIPLPGLAYDPLTRSTSLTLSWIF